MFMTLLATFKTLLYRYTGQTDIILGSPIANRNLTKIEDLIGFFVNTLALRTDLSNNPTFRDLLDRVRQGAMEAYAHQDTPFDVLVEALQPDRDPSRSPLFQVMFALRNVPSVTMEIPELTLSYEIIYVDTAQFDMTVEAEELPQGLKIVFEYNTNLFEATTITRMMAHFQNLLEAIVSDPDTQISQLPLMTETEHHQVLVDQKK